MEFTATLLSHDFLTSSENDTHTVQASRDLWNRVVRSETGGRIFLRMIADEKEWIAPLGNPVIHDTNARFSEDTIFMPFWMIDAAGFNGSGENITCEVLNTDAFPEATKITLKVVDSAFYNSDVKEQLEIALTRLGVIRKHTTLQIPIDSLGGFLIDIFVVATEPADIVLCEGEEVTLEFEEPVDHFEIPASTPITSARPPTPIPIPQLPRWC